MATAARQWCTGAILGDVRDTFRKPLSVASSDHSRFMATLACQWLGVETGEPPDFVVLAAPIPFSRRRVKIHRSETRAAL
jgi:hypothetical protein